MQIAYNADRIYPDSFNQEIDMAPDFAFSRIAGFLQDRMHQHELGSRKYAGLIAITHTTLIRALKGNSMDLPME